MARATPWRWAGFVAMVMLVCHGALQQLALWHLTDSLFVTLTIAGLATGTRLIVVPQVRWALATSALAAAAMLVRPAGYYLIGVLAFLALTTPRPARRAVAVALLSPALAALALAAGANAVRFGVFAPQVIGGYSLAGHVAAKIGDSPSSPYPELGRRLEARVAPIIARRPAHGYPLGYQRVSSDDYNEILWKTVVPEVREFAAATAPGADVRVETSAVAGALARAAILDHPWWYVRHVAAHFAGLAAPLLEEPPRLDLEVAWAAEHSNRLLARSPLLRDAGIAPSPVPAGELPSPVASLIWLLDLPWVVLAAYASPILVVLGIATVAFAILAIVTGGPYPRLAALFGLSAVGYLLLVAAVQVALYRYTLVAVAPTLLLLLLLTAGAAARIRERFA